MSRSCRAGPSRHKKDRARSAQRMDLGHAMDRLACGCTASSRVQTRGRRPDARARCIRVTVSAKASGTIPHAVASSSSEVAAFQVAAAKVGRQRKREGLGKPQTISALKTMVADEPRRDFLTLRHCRHHGGRVVVVAIGFVDEALAAGQHADHTGLGPVDDVREVANAYRRRTAPWIPAPTRRAKRGP